MGFLSFLGGQFQYLKRYNQIISVLVKYGFEDFVSYLDEKKQFKFIRNLIPQKSFEESIRLTKWEKIRIVCEELGPSFVKFGQIVSTRPDLLPPELIVELEKLQDGVPPVPGKQAIQVIEQQLGKKIDELFFHFDETAFASASMAQVHRAVLKSGEQVVIKVQRPGIKEIIESDIKVMLYMADIFQHRIPSLKSFDPVGLVKMFEKSIEKELDFIHESINLQRFAANFNENEKFRDQIYTPKVYREFSTSTVLTLEFIDGIKANQLQKISEYGMDKKLIARRIVESYFLQVFEHGFFHADPHPGNILVKSGSLVCFIDYGMMGSVLPKDLEQMGNLFIAVKEKDVRKIIRAIQYLSDNTVIRNFRSLETDISEFVNSYAVLNMNQNEMSMILTELKDIIIKHHLKVPSHFFLLARSLVNVEGLARQLDPTLDLVDVARPYMLKAVAKKYNPVAFFKKGFNSLYEFGQYMEEFPRDFKNAFRKINSGEIKVDLQHKGIDPLVHTINRVSKQIISAVIISALIIGGSLLTVAKMPPLWNGFSVLAIICFVIATFLSIGLINNVRKGDRA